jgi:hypothetical protein
LLIDEFAEGVLEELDAFAAASEKHNLYVLIDGAFDPGLQRRFIAELGGHALHLLFDDLPSVTEEVLDVSPFVFRYLPGNPAIRELLKRCSGLPMLSAIASPEPLQTLAERLSAWTIIASDGARFNFRFADTRRLPTILRMLRDEQLGAMVGPALAWHYVARTGQWAMATLSGASAPVNPRPQTLDSEQFASMADDAEADAMLAGIKKSGHVFQGCPSEHFQCVVLVWEAAIARGLDRVQVYSLFQATDARHITDVSSAEAMATQIRAGTWEGKQEVMS